MNNCSNRPDPEEYELDEDTLAISLFTKGMLCGILFGLLTHILL
jgi:hypothetical protein